MKSLEFAESITVRAADAIRRAILRGDLQPGVLYSVSSVAQDLGVSRTPAREALINLAAEGMIRFERNRGFVVRHTTALDLREIYSLRLLLEVPATFAATRTATDAEIAALAEDIAAMRREMEAGDAESFLSADRGFHRSLLLLGGNARLATFVDGLRNVVLMSGVTTANRTESISEILPPHIAILDHVRSRDAHAAAEAMRTHLLQSGRLVLTQEFGADAAKALDDHLQQLSPGAPFAPLTKIDASGT